MKDKWINAGYDGEDLKPHIEPVEDYSDPARIGELAQSCSSTDLSHNQLYASHRGDGRDGVFTGGNQGLSTQSEVQ